MATVTFVLQNLDVPHVANNITVQLDGILQIREARVDGVALQSLTPANFTVLFINSSSRVHAGPNTVSLFLQASTDIPPMSNITISGLLGSSTIATENLTVSGPLATRFTSAYYVNRTNTSSGYVKSGVIRGMFQQTPHFYQINPPRSIYFCRSHRISRYLVTFPRAVFC